MPLIASTAMRIAREMYDEIVAHAQADNPDECCGIVSVDGDRVATRVYRTTNVEASPLRFVIDPRELYRVHTDIEDAGLTLGAIYHSHTRSEPYPSQTDINFAKGWPGVLWIIVGLAGDGPTVRTFEIADGRVSEAELDVV
ncbi:MAG TPA: M67 family metallopeptidase [Solirubrobacteraceae bacterium]|nr:M67 family metallopeptidase [Solirubrobacteraceae bacterium]